MNLSAHKGPDAVVAEILMLRTIHRGSFLVVEGDDDSRFFRGRVNRACELVIAGGKLSVEGSFERLDKRGFRGAVGVCDDDCESLEHRRPDSVNIVVTEWRDLDTLLVRSPALDRVLSEYADPDSLRRYEAANGPIRDNLVRLAITFGRLRWHSHRQQLGINFERLTPFRFVNSNWSLKPESLFHAAGTQIQVSPTDLERGVKALPAADPWSLCQGHDLLALLAIGLSKGGALGTRAPGAKTIAAMLRTSLDDDHWRATRVYAELKAWESAQPPFYVLASQ